jgi:hypothetical protein
MQDYDQLQQAALAIEPDPRSAASICLTAGVLLLAKLSALNPDVDGEAIMKETCEAMTEAFNEMVSTYRKVLK